MNNWLDWFGAAVGIVALFNFCLLVIKLVERMQVLKREIRFRLQFLKETP